LPQQHRLAEEIITAPAVGHSTATASRTRAYQRQRSFASSIASSPISEAFQAWIEKKNQLAKSGGRGAPLG